VPNVLVLSMHEEKKLLIVGLLWAWWDARNKADVGEQRRTTEEVIYIARSVMHHEETVADSMQARGQARSWTPPPPDVSKINVDAAFWMEELAGAWGFVIRDSDATAALAGAGRLAVVSDALCSETQAYRAALEAAASQGMQHIILETDSQILVKALQTNEHDPSRGGVLFREAKFVLATMPSSWSIVHVIRSGNSVAHDLARLGRGRDPDHPIVWMHPLPAVCKRLAGP
jgi:ribonuclease HI